MTPTTTKREPTAAERRRTSVARERGAGVTGLLAGLDVESRIETSRAAIRALAQAVKADGGEGRAVGVLCGALVDVSPAYRAERPAMAKAEALFLKPTTTEQI